MLFKFVKAISRRCSFCKLHDETIMPLFYDCLIVKGIWNQLKSILSNNVNFPISTSQTAIFGFWDLDTNEHLILNHLLLIFKMYIYNARATGYFNVSHLLMYIIGIKDTTEQKMKFPIKNFFSKCDQIRSFLGICLHLLKKSLMESFIFCVVYRKETM